MFNQYTHDEDMKAQNSMLQVQYTESLEKLQSEISDLKEQMRKKDDIICNQNVTFEKNKMQYWLLD